MACFKKCFELGQELKKIVEDVEELYVKFADFIINDRVELIKILVDLWDEYEEYDAESKAKLDEVIRRLHEVNK